MTMAPAKGTRIPRPTAEVLADLKAAGKDVEQTFNDLVKYECDRYFDPGDQILMQGSADEAAYKEFMQRTETNFLELLVIGTNVQVWTSTEGAPVREREG